MRGSNWLSLRIISIFQLQVIPRQWIKPCHHIRYIQTKFIETNYLNKCAFFYHFHCHWILLSWLFINHIVTHWIGKPKNVNKDTAVTKESVYSIIIPIYYISDTYKLLKNLDLGSTIWRIGRAVVFTQALTSVSAFPFTL
jgi:hypothetical protein